MDIPQTTLVCTRCFRLWADDQVGCSCGNVAAIRMVVPPGYIVDQRSLLLKSKVRLIQSLPRYNFGAGREGEVTAIAHQFVSVTFGTFTLPMDYEEFKSYFEIIP